MVLATASFALVLLVTLRRRAALRQLAQSVPLPRLAKEWARMLTQLRLPYDVRDALYICASLLFFGMLVAVTFSWAA